MEEANLSVSILETLAMAHNIELSGGRMDEPNKKLQAT